MGILLISGRNKYRVLKPTTLRTRKGNSKERDSATPNGHSRKSLLKALIEATVTLAIALVAR